MAPNKAPWTDYNGKDIYEGDKIIHPVSGQGGVVKHYQEREEPTDAWCVDYGADGESRLCLQIGDRGQAVVCT